MTELKETPYWKVLAKVQMGEHFAKAKYYFDFGSEMNREVAMAEAKARYMPKAPFPVEIIEIISLTPLKLKSFKEKEVKYSKWTRPRQLRKEQKKMTREEEKEHWKEVRNQIRRGINLPEEGEEDTEELLCEKEDHGVSLFNDDSTIEEHENNEAELFKEYEDEETTETEGFDKW